MRIVFGFLMGIFLGLQSVSFGAEQISDQEGAPIPELDPVVITASAGPTQLTKAPASVTVISRPLIEQQQANRLSEVLVRVPGLYVDELGGRGGLSSVYLRGGDPNFTMVMIDGVPINDQTNPRGGSVDLSLLTPERIQRVEVIRGPLSALYGSEAVSGVINIITQSGRDQSHQLIRGEGGRFGYARGVFQASGPFKPVPSRYALSMQYNRNDAQVEGDQFQLGTVGWHFNLPADSPFQLQLTGKFLQTSTDAFPEGSGGPRLAILRLLEEQETQQFVTGLQIAYPIRSDWHQNLFLNVFRQIQDVNNPGVLVAENTFQIPPTIFQTIYTQFRPRWQQTIMIHPEWSFTTGAQLIAEVGKRSGIQKLSATGFATDQLTDFNRTRLTPAIFAETTATFIPQLNLTAGLRLDIPEGFDDEISPRVAIRYQIVPSLSVRAGYGQGFKLPSLASLGDPLIGNLELNPETNTAWDAGFLTTLSEGRAILECTYFHNRFMNLIDLDPTLARQGIFRLVNLQTATTQGVESSITVTPIQWFSVYGFLTYLATKIEGTSDPLRNRPEWAGGVILTAEPSSQWTLRTQIRFVGERSDLQIPTTTDKVAGFGTVDLAVTYRPTPSWHIFGVIENLTDTSYENFLGFTAPGVSPRFGVEYVS